MRSVSRFGAPVWFAALGGLLACGCGGGSEKGVQAQGRLLKDGQPYTVAETEELQLTFLSEEDQKISSMATVNPDGTFRVGGREGNGIPPGTYRITVKSLPYQYTSVEEGGPEPDKFKGRYSLPKTPLKVDVAPGAGEIVIDLGKGTVGN